MYPHRIRLRGPWQCEPLASEENAQVPRARTVTLPCNWADAGLEGFRGRALFRRHFGAPRQIDYGERVWLTFEGLTDYAEVWLNEELLGQHRNEGDFEFEITRRIDDRNELVVEATSTSDQGGLCGEISLEIRCAAFLRNIQLTTEAAPHSASLRAGGLVVGASDQPLEARLFLNGDQVAEETIEPTDQGVPFNLVAEGLRVRRARPDEANTNVVYRVRLDLRQGPAVWYVHEELVEFMEKA